MHIDDELAELGLVKDAIAVCVLLFELEREFGQEVLVLLELVVEHDLDELCESDFTLEPDLLLLRHLLLAGQFAVWLDAYQVVEGVVVRADSRLVDSSGEEVGAELVLFRFSLRLYEVEHFLDEDLGVAVVVHPGDHLFPDRLVDFARAALLFQGLYHVVDVCFCLCWVFLPEDALEHCDQCVLHVHLYIPELLVTFVL